jgi:two-component system cell cycle response regulator DivK
VSLILIVEDNPRNMKLVRDVLQVKGHTTLEAVNAEDGIVLATERVPDLILMDIQLPGMNGIQALAKLREAEATKSIPVIAFTASVMPSDRHTIMAAGFNAFLSKPIAIKELTDTVAAQIAARGAK